MVTVRGYLILLDIISVSFARSMTYIGRTLWYTYVPIYIYVQFYLSIPICMGCVSKQTWNWIETRWNFQITEYVKCWLIRVYVNTMRRWYLRNYSKIEKVFCVVSMKLFFFITYGMRILTLSSLRMSSDLHLTAKYKASLYLDVI